MVFVNTKKNGDYLSKALEKAGYKSAAIHSGKSQVQCLLLLFLSYCYSSHLGFFSPVLLP